MMEVVVEVRRCHGCGNKMKVMPSSMQTHCMQRCEMINQRRWAERNEIELKNERKERETVTVKDIDLTQNSGQRKPFGLSEWPRLRKRSSGKEPETEEEGPQMMSEENQESESENGLAPTETRSMSIVEPIIEIEQQNESDSKSMTVAGDVIRSMESRAQSGNLSEEISHSMNVLNSSIEQLHSAMKKILPANQMENEDRILDLDRVQHFGMTGKVLLETLRTKLEFAKFKRELDHD